MTFEMICRFLSHPEYFTILWHIKVEILETFLRVLINLWEYFSRIFKAAIQDFFTLSFMDYHIYDLVPFWKLLLSDYQLCNLDLSYLLLPQQEGTIKCCRNLNKFLRKYALYRRNTKYEVRRLQEDGKGDITHWKL